MEKTQEQFFADNQKAMSVEQFKALVDYLKNKDISPDHSKVADYANKLIAAISQITEDKTLEQMFVVLTDKTGNGLCFLFGGCANCDKILTAIRNRRETIT